MDCGHIYVPNRMKWGSTSSPHIGDVMMSLFFTLGSTVHDWGWPKNGPFWTKNGQTWQACQRSKVVQRGPKGTKMVNLSLFEHLGPFWAHLDPFGPFQTRIDILLRSTSAKPYFVDFRAYFGPFSLVNGVKHENLSLNVNFWSITLKFFL